MCHVMTRSPLLRPMLIPGLSRVWRDRHTLQLGLDPARGVLIDLPDPRAADVLDLLDGTLPERLVVARATRRGVPAEDTIALLGLLHAAGFVLGAHTLLPGTLPEAARQRLVGEAAALAMQATRAHDACSDNQPTPAHILRRRAAARVVVAGRGRLAAGVAVALAESGVGHVHPDLSGAVSRRELAGGPLGAADAGRPRADAVAEAVHRAAPATRTHRMRRGTASLVVHLGYEQPVALLAAGHRGRRQAHLAVAIRQATAVVGPLVPATGGPCLHCLDLHRCERDARWPDLVAQLGPVSAEPCSVTTVLAATAYAVAEALTFLDGGSPETIGAAVEIGAAGRFRRRRWTPHPACGCTRPPGRPAPA